MLTKLFVKDKSSNDLVHETDYIVVGDRSSEYEHLDLFVDNVDNLSTGKCVLKIGGDTRTSLV